MMCIQFRVLSCSSVCFFGAVCTVGFHCVAFFAAAAAAIAAILPLLLYHVFLSPDQIYFIHLCLIQHAQGRYTRYVTILFVIPAPTGHEEDSTLQWAAEKRQTNQ